MTTAVSLEHDLGNADEAAENVRKKVEDAEAAEKALAAFTGATPDNHVMPEWFRDIVIGWFPEVAASLFGLADNYVGKEYVVVLDDKRDIRESVAPPLKGKHGQNDYNVALDLDGGGEGRYWLYFKVDLFEHTGDCVVALPSA